MFVGNPGDGKSVTARRIGWLWCGFKWDVMPPSEKEDDALTSLTSQPIVCFDNMDTRVAWMQDLLARAATGMEVQKRALYSDGTLYLAKCIAFPMVTSHDPVWIKRGDVLQRSLPIHMGPRAKQYLAEHALIKREASLRPARLGHLLTVANSVVRQLRDGAQPQMTHVRIADFPFVGGLIANAMGKGAEFTAAIEKLPREQQRFLAEDHPLIDAMSELMNRGNYGREIDQDELYKSLAEIGGWSERRGVRSASQMNERIKEMKSEIERRVGQFREGRHHTSLKRTYYFFKDSDEPDLPLIDQDVEGVPF
jgi:hypothetical protein